MANEQSGLGNPLKNSIPACQLIRLQRLVDELYPPEERPVAFWLDTLCVPLRKRFRRVAISLMASIYDCAEKVLVLDSSLLQVSTTAGSTLELHVRLMTSRWGQRLWTFHEAALASKLCYQFADRALTRRQLANLWLRSLQRSPPDSVGSCDGLNQPAPISGEARESAFRILLADPIARHAYSWLVGLERFSTIRSTGNWPAILQFILNHLRNRTTSWQTDEVVCVAGLLGLSVLQHAFMSKKNVSQRLQNLILFLPSVPLDLIFADLPRSSESGFPWIPSTFSGRSSRSAMAKSHPAYLTGDGLRFMSLGFHLHGRLQSVFDDNCLHLKYQEHIYCMYPLDQSDAAFRWWSNELSNLAVVLREPLTHPGQATGALVVVLKTVETEQRCLYLYPVLILGRDELVSLAIDHRAPIISCTAHPESQQWCLTPGTVTT